MIPPLSKIFPHFVVEEAMSVQLLLFVIAVLLFVIFWELCKINSHLNKTLSIASRMFPEGQAHDAVTPKAVEAR